ncbi:MAG: toxin-antitoxin system YwqK family antitoxin [Bacteroidetes bacterium]|nr:toxin-antitoxin system YwqK family antitoxin [Bacteroidota bacterium]
MRCSALIFLFTLLACNQKPETSSSTAVVDQTTPQPTMSTSGGGEEGIPAGAIKEEFADTPGLVRVTLVDQGGLKSADGYYLNNKRHGAWTEYQTNGLVKSVTTYFEGKKEGLCMEMENGQMAKRFYYHSGLRHGDYKEFKSTSLKEERNYVNGKIEGTVRIYYDYNSKLMEEGNYKNGVRDGVSKWYDQDGKLSIEYEYKNGELVKK